MNVKDLRKAVEEAYRVRLDVEKRRDMTRRELLQNVDETLRASYGAELEAANVKERALRDDLRKAEDAERMANVVLPYPEGTVLNHWSRGRYYTISSSWRTTGKRAVVQVYRQGDPLPVNARYNRPEVGQVVLRELKKDGTPGKAVEIWYESAMKNEWLPEGTKPGA